jgi:alpha-beta hydrolase superfamily lysophospholipase
VIVLASAVLLAAAYAGAGAVGWLALTSVDPCKWTAVTPATFPGRWRADESLVVDSRPYQFSDFTTVAFPSETPGLSLRAWWSPPAAADGPVVLVVHGRNSCRGDPQVLMPAGMLHRAGFGVLVVDLRDSGESDREDGHWSGGVDEWQDVTGAWRWLTAQGYPARSIGLMGVSMGTGAITLAMAREPGMAAAFLDSPWADMPSEAGFIAEHAGIPGVLVPAVLGMGQLISGDELLGLSPERAFAESLAGRPVSIVHGTADALISVEQGKRLAAAAGVSGSPVDLWLLPGVEHVQAAFVDPAAYEQRVVDFFTATLGAPAAWIAPAPR